MESKRAADAGQPAEQATDAAPAARIAQLMDTMFAQRSALVAIIEFCSSERTSAEIDAMLEPMQAHRLNVYSPITMRGLLEKAGALEYHDNDHEPEVVEDSQGNLVLPAPAVCTWTTTKDGLAFIAGYDPLADLVEALDASGDLRDVYVQILRMCGEQDRSVQEIEQEVGANELLADKPQEPGFFVGRLEDLGALEWRGMWRTSDLGKQYLSRSAE